MTSPAAVGWERIGVAARDATEAARQLTEALKPRTEAEYWQWLRHNDPLRYIVEQRAHRGARSPVLGMPGFHYRGESP